MTFEFVGAPPNRAISGLALELFRNPDTGKRETPPTEDQLARDACLSPAPQAWRYVYDGRLGYGAGHCFVLWRPTVDRVIHWARYQDSYCIEPMENVLNLVAALRQTHPKIVGTFDVDSMRIRSFDGLPSVCEVLRNCVARFFFSSAGIAEDAFQLQLNGDDTWYAATRDDLLRACDRSSGEIKYCAALHVSDGESRSVIATGMEIARCAVPSAAERRIPEMPLEDCVRPPPFAVDGSMWYTAYGWMAFAARREWFAAMLSARHSRNENWIKAPPDKMFVYTASGYEGKLHTIDATRFVWHHTAHLRWPFNHAVVLDVCIALRALALPPYVLLEIVDWLPHMATQSHRRKIDLIFGVQRSFDRVAVIRANCSASNFRTS